MFIIRPVKIEDLDQIISLASEAKTGLTTLPCDRKILTHRVERSIESFQKDVKKPEGEIYFFVIEDVEKQKVLGTCSVISKVGGFEPFYSYEIKTAVHESTLLKVKKEIQYLQLLRNHSGPSEIGTLFLHPDARLKGNGRLLSLSRFLFMAQYRQRFEKEVIAELRGVFDEQGESPFWNAVCKHFFVIDYKKADLMGMEDKSFIEELIPRHPIYIPLLPQEAQDVIGEVHKNTRPALLLLIQEGFEMINQVDIFEAGPVVSANLDDVRAVKESRAAVVASVTNEAEESYDYLIANVEAMENFRVAMGALDINAEGTVNIGKDVAQGLGIMEGNKIRFVMSRKLEADFRIGSDPVKK